MQSKTTVFITLHPSETLMLMFHPQMTTLELQELIRASYFLSDDVIRTTSKTQRQTFLLSQARNLITDYLLTSTTHPLSKICGMQQRYTLFNKTLYEIKIQDLLQQCNNNKKIDQKASTLNLQIIYPEDQKENKTTLLCYQYLNDKKKSLIQQIDEKNMKFQTEIVISKEKNSFHQRIKVKKQSLKTYHNFESLMIIRQRLIQSTKNHINIFEQLTNTCQDKQYLIFQLNYVPAIKITQILKYNLQLQYKTRIVEKVLAFMYHLSCNGFQNYLEKIYQNRKISLLLEKISIDINQNIHVTDIKIILQQDQKSQHKMKKDGWRDFEIYTQRYISTLNTSNTDTQQKMISAEVVFIELFSVKYYKFSSITLDKYSPQCKFFFWESSQFQKNLNVFRNEGTTIKKKINQDPTKKRLKSQKTKARYKIQFSESNRREKISKNQNRSFA